MPTIFPEDSTARALEEPRAEPTTVAAATPEAVWLRNSRRVNLFAGEALFIEKKGVKLMRFVSLQEWS